jgi:hypothetical protein
MPIKLRITPLKSAPGSESQINPNKRERCCELGTTLLTVKYLVERSPKSPNNRQHTVVVALI